MGIRVSQDLLKIVAASGMRGENDALRTNAGDAQALLYLREAEIDEFLKTAGSAESRKVVSGAAVRAGVVAAGEQCDGRPLPAIPRILPGGIAEIKPADGLDVAAEIEAPGVLAGAALGVSVEMDDDVNRLRFGAQVVPNDDEVGPSLSAVCGEQRYAVDFQMSAFPDALTGGLAGGLLGDLALRIGGSGICGRRLWFGRRSSVVGIGGCGVGGCGVRWCGLGWCSLWRRGFWRCGSIGKAVVSKGCCLRSGLRTARGGGAK